ncbi:MAG: DNA-directed RNA polymerase subunit N [Candidatus Diapherotrites archaeon]
MMIPIRCFSCGKVIAEYYEKYVERVKAGENPEKVLDDLGIKRYCCRRMIFSHVDTIDELNKYKV